jgi:DNA polymerase I
MGTVTPKRLVIIDGKSVFYRGYYAMPGLSLPDGTPTGGVYGFAALSLEVFKKLKPDYVAVAWDKPKTNIRKRKELYPEYKAGRKPAPPDFYVQIPILHELLEAFGWPLYELDDYEADDIMGALAEQASKKGIEACLVTSDLDVLQCIGPLTHVYAMKKGFTNIELFHSNSFEAKYGIKPTQFLDLKSLKGDSSDNIPGVPGVGEKTALDLLKKFDTLDGVYEHLSEVKESVRKKLEAGKDSAYLSKKIAEIWCDAPIKLDLEAMDVTKLDAPKLKKMLTELEFRSLLRNLPEHMRVKEEVAEVAKQSDIKPALVKKFDQTAREVLQAAPVVAIMPVNADHWLLSPRVGEAYQVTVKEAAKLLAGRNIIAHDAKEYLKQLLDFAKPQNLPTVHHDTEQAAFLLNPLARAHDLGEITGLNVTEPLVAISALWQLYAEQGKQLEHTPELAHVAREIDFALIPVLATIEKRGIILDCKVLANMSKDLQQRADALANEMYKMAGYEFNIGSPAQLADVLYGKLQLPTTGIKRGKTGFSTGQAELDKLRGQHPIIEKIEEYRELTKLQNTYVDALPKLVDAQDRLHTTFNQDVAATGRLSSTDPNLQNIPVRTELGRKIREAFVPAKGNVFVSADYSQFELRLIAVMAGDEGMVKAFNEGLDIHAKTASDLFDVPLSEVTKLQRRNAKVVNFGVLYGMSPHGLSVATGMSFSEAKRFIDNYYHRRPAIRAYLDKVYKQAIEKGYVETLFGRRRPTPDIKSSNFAVREAAKRAALNMPIQGTEADLMKMAMVEVQKELLGRGSGAEMLLQIHDSILLECPEGEAEDISGVLKQIMESIATDLKIDLRVDVTTGKNWGEL